MGRRVRGMLPQIRHHKPTNSGRVYLAGKTYTVGRYGSAEAEHRYRELLAEHGIELPLATWLTSRRRTSSSARVPNLAAGIMASGRRARAAVLAFS